MNINEGHTELKDKKGTDVEISSQRLAVDKQHILEERARLLARAPEEKDEKEKLLEVQAFHLGTEYLGVPTSMVQEIQPLHAHRFCRVLCAPPFIAGIVNLRGSIYSIMDIAAFWGLPPRPVSENTHILLVRGINQNDNQEIEFTILIDECAEVRTVKSNELKPPPSTVSARMQSYIKGVTDDLMMVIDLELLFSDPGIIVSEGE